MPEFDFDDWVDGQLRNVPVPPDLHARLSAIRPSQELTDEALDESLRAVPVPEGLGKRLRAVAWRSRRRSYGAAALAASVLVAAGAVYLSLGSSEDAPQAPVAQVAPPAQEAAPPVADIQVAANPPQRPRRQKPVTVRLGPTPASETTADLPGAFREVADVGASLKQVINAKLQAQSTLGAGGRIERLPELEFLEPPVPRGVEPPRIRGYDMLFQLRYGEHPFVSPAAHKQLRVSRVPFTSRTTSYDLAAAAAQSGRLPEAGEIRVEDFLAAQDYRLPEAPRQPLALHVGACPSPLGVPGPYLMQLAVQGGRGPGKHAPTRLILVAETSAAMEYDARWKAFARALERLAEQMGPQDRVTLIGFSESPQVLAEDLTGRQLASWIAEGRLPDTAGWADFAGAVQSACDAVLAVESNEARRVVFVTSGRSEMDDAGFSRARDELAGLAAANIPWHVVQLSPQADLERWQQLARHRRGGASAAQSTDALYAVLLEQLLGRDSSVAAGVTVRIQFDPKRINSYRLLGHEAATLTGEAGDPLRIELSPEQVATCMYELWVKPPTKDAKGPLGSVEVVWRDPKTGKPGRMVRPLTDAHLAGSFADAPTWVQQGVLAARTAEFLRGSYFLPNSRRLEQLLDLARQVDAQTAKQPDFRELVELIETSARLR
ncbi:MAG: VWA domain-containing protein [Planctomycetota bacterium]|nr:MAG: VWA domain-containing protein [Planctomycetota bacterium]